jgi:phosphatidate cytidylyltransferase
MVGTPVVRPDRPGPRWAAGGNELTLRVASALVLAPLALVIAYVGGWPFVVFWGIGAVAVLWEWTSLAAKTRRGPVFAASAVALVAAFAFTGMGQPGIAVALVAIGAAVAAVLAPAGHRVWTAAGLLYAGALIAPVLLRADAGYGFLAVIFLFAVVWVTDILAFFAGRAIGGPKLWLRVSPKKTWSGAIGGAAGAMAAGLAAALIAGLGNVPAVVLLAFGLSAASQVGDLAESAIKRSFGTKDASHLIPGHGGVMDRLDGFLAAALVAAIIGLMRGGADATARGLLVW